MPGDPDITFTLKARGIKYGDPELHDNWHDIQGYAQLAAARVKPRKSGYAP